MSLARLALLATDTYPPAGSGTIEGGWEYVWMAYGVTWTVLVLYGLSLWLRRPKAETKGGP